MRVAAAIAELLPLGRFIRHGGETTSAKAEGGHAASTQAAGSRRGCGRWW
jgi:hypothetical protein